MSSMSTALLDGDIITHRAAAACQDTIRWDADTTSVQSDFASALDFAHSLVTSWAEQARCKQFFVCFSGDINFRKLVLPSYKMHRAGKAKPLAHAPLKVALQAAYQTHLVEGMEADDLMGIMATNGRYPDAVIVTLDKDLKTVPGLHLNPLKDQRPHRVTEAFANRLWLTQTLTGDPTDGYTGIPGIGPAKAQRILDGPSLATDVETLWGRVVAAYRAAGLTVADALQQARVARILRSSDYDKETRCVKLWHPTTPVEFPLADILAGVGPALEAEQEAAPTPRNRFTAGTPLGG